MPDDLELPAEFPPTWDAMPRVVRQYLALRLVTRALEIHEGPSGLIKFLYAGTRRRDAAGVPFRVSYLSSGRDAWAYVCEDVHAWVAARGATTPFPSPESLSP